MKQYLLKKKGYAVRYQDLPGVEPPLVFLHGLGCASSFEYPAVMAEPALLGRRALLIDLLGTGYRDQPLAFGYSVEEHAACLNEMLTSLNLQQIVLFGHSLGGAVAICLAGLLGERLFSLILTESNLDPSRGSAVSRKIGTQSSEAFLAHGYADLLARAQKSNPLWGATLAHWLPEAVWRISRSAMQGGSPSWRQQLYELQKPKSYLFGEHSLPSADVDALRAHGVRVEIIPDAGHSMALENPAVLAETIAMILKDCMEER
jgi:haloalkane dehalogenase